VEEREAAFKRKLRASPTGGDRTGEEEILVSRPRKMP
jgi:hypothetical protein